MYLVLSMVSNQATALITDLSYNVIATKKWTIGVNADTEISLENSIDALFKNDDIKEIKKLFCVSGPGSFTGLRISAAYMMGLQNALNVPLQGIPTLNMYNEDSVFISIQQHHTSKISSVEAINKKYKFLKVSKDSESYIQTPNAQDKILGCIESDDWPKTETILNGLRSFDNTKMAFELNYGLTPTYKKTEQ